MRWKVLLAVVMVLGTGAEEAAGNVVVPFGRLSGMTVREVGQRLPTDLIALTNRQFVLFGGSPNAGPRPRVTDLAKKALDTVLLQAEEFRASAGAASPIQDAGWWQRLRESRHAGEIDAGCKQVYQQLGAFTRLPDAEWWAVWRNARHKDIVNAARKVTDDGRLCLVCGTGLGEGELTHDRVHNECVEGLSRDHLAGLNLGTSPRAA